MLHLVPQLETDAPDVYAEAISRLASVRHALRMVDVGVGTGPEDDLDAQVASAWPQASEAKQRWFDRRSSELVGIAAAGIETLISERTTGRKPHPEASTTLVAEIRRELRDIAGIVLA